MDSKPPELLPPTPTEEEVAAASIDVTPSIFPLFPSTASSSSVLATTTVPQWLSNSSFTADVSLINKAVASQLHSETSLSPPQRHRSDDDEEEEEDDGNRAQEKPYEILESSESEGRYKKEKRSKKKRKKKQKRDRSPERGGLDAYSSTKSGVRAWADSESSTAAKDYYFDSHGDRDNLAFGSIYRMDIAPYKPYNPSKLSGLNVRGLYWSNWSVSLLERDSDVDTLDGKLKSAGRYWSGKYTALERHKVLSVFVLLHQSCLLFWWMMSLYLCQILVHLIELQIVILSLKLHQSL